MLKYAAAVALLLAASPAFAQSGATQSPPAPNASSSGPTPANSVPPSATTMSTGSTANPNVGGALGGTGAAVSSQPAGAPSAAMSTTVPTPAK